MNKKDNKTILVTGGAGFIGANFVEYLLGKYPEYTVVNLDALTYAGELSNLSSISNSEKYIFIHGDIGDRTLIESIFKNYNIQGVINFAAESHVDNSIHSPLSFIETNIKGTFTLLDVAYKHWMERPFVYKKPFNNSRFLHISTDEVYGSLGAEGLFTETTAYAPNSPYSASKASSDMLVRAYHETYGVNTIVTNCSNNYGPKQHDEKFIPTIIRKALSHEKIPVYGDGQNIRDWLYVIDHCKGVDLAYHFGESGQTYNIGGRNEKTNLEIVDAICTILDKEVAIKSNMIKSYKDLISFVDDRAGHDRRYAIDAKKIETKLGWCADENFESGIKKTILWYINKYL
ncbi:dTDP-glucose 4,6-dehydratase [Cysteiniphilum sp. JM-1]|uniref:dTDP-glucose 4,6-dehydratase n=1 Tax=Cysteiniphilum TaxID=2056696 RepID=UPI00124791D9|nr:dTDP-glucose 4,6-dehydratase [Cysteiniphilum sp. JM-1]